MRVLRVTQHLQLPAGADPLLSDPVHWLPVPVQREATNTWRSLLCVGQFGVPALYRISLPAWNNGSTVRRVMAEPVPELRWPLRHLPFLDGDIATTVAGDGEAVLTWTGRWSAPASGLSWLIGMLGLYRPVVRAAARETLAEIAARLADPGEPRSPVAIPHGSPQAVSY